MKTIIKNNKDYNNLREIVNKYDPIDLFPGKLAPVDEYMVEIEKIMPLLEKSLSEEELTDAVKSIFIYFFGKSGLAEKLPEVDEKYRGIAKEIIFLKQK